MTADLAEAQRQQQQQLLAEQRALDVEDETRTAEEEGNAVAAAIAEEAKKTVHVALEKTRPSLQEEEEQRLRTARD